MHHTLTPAFAMQCPVLPPSAAPVSAVSPDFPVPHTADMLVFLERNNRDGSEATISTLTNSQGQWHASALAHVDHSPDGVAVFGNKIYWTAMGVPSEYPQFCNRDGSINLLEQLNGVWSNRRLAEGVVTPKQCCIDSGKLYFCDREGLAIYSLELETNALQRLHSSGTADQMLDCERQNVGCAVQGRTLYFTQKGPPKGGKGKICALHLNTHEVRVLLSGLPEPIDLAIQGTTLYWTDRGAPPEGNSLNRAELVEGSLTDHKVLVAGFDEAIGLTITGSLAYVADLGGSIYEVNLDTLEKNTIYHSGKPLTGIEYVSTLN